MTNAEEQVLGSAFLDHVRDLKFNAGEFALLKEALRAVAGEWASTEVVNKSVACELVLIPVMVRGAAQRLGEPESKALHSAADELEALVLRCFCADAES